MASFVCQNVVSQQNVPDMSSHMTPPYYLVLQGAVLALRHLSDDDKVKVLVTSRAARQTLHRHNIGKQVETASVGSKGWKVN